MQFERALLLPICCPKIQRQADIDKRRIERIQLFLEPEAVPGRKVAALLHERIKHLLEDVGVPIGVRIGQSASGNNGLPQMIPFPMVLSEADLNITETGQSFCLGKQQY